MGERRGTKALELWCRRMTDGYPGVKIDNMTTSWRDGLAFCAMIHHFRPELIEFEKLNKGDIYYNNDLAFRTAERHLGIPALLDADDMAAYEVPDRLSILTYLSQFYQVFAAQDSPNRLKRPSATTEKSQITKTQGPPAKMAHVVGVPKRDPCQKCGLPVFLAERLTVGKRVYHRTCLKCARCSSQLTPGSFYETESDGEYCCETCPDEETSLEVETQAVLRNPSPESYDSELAIRPKTTVRSSIAGRLAFFEQSKDSPASSSSKLLQKSLSDEEKTKSLKRMSGETSPPYKMNPALSSFMNSTLEDEIDGEKKDCNVSLNLAQMDTSDSLVTSSDSEDDDDDDDDDEEEEDEKVVVVDDGDKPPKLPNTLPPQREESKPSTLEREKLPLFSDAKIETLKPRNLEDVIQKHSEPLIATAEITLRAVEEKNTDDTNTKHNIDNKNENDDEQVEESLSTTSIITIAKITDGLTLSKSKSNFVTKDNTEPDEQMRTNATIVVESTTLPPSEEIAAAAATAAAPTEKVDEHQNQQEEVEPKQENEQRQLKEKPPIRQRPITLDIKTNCNSEMTAAHEDEETANRLSVVRARLHQFEVIANNKNTNDNLMHRTPENSSSVNSSNIKSDNNSVKPTTEPLHQDEDEAEITVEAVPVVAEAEIKMKSEEVPTNNEATEINVEIKKETETVSIKENNLKQRDDDNATPLIPATIVTPTEINLENSARENPKMMVSVEIKVDDADDHDAKIINEVEEESQQTAMDVEKPEAEQQIKKKDEPAKPFTSPAKVNLELYPEELNPFQSDDEDDDIAPLPVVTPVKPVTPAPRRSLNTSTPSPATGKKEDKDKSLNPFDSSDDEVEMEKKVKPPRPPPPKISKNPFGSESEEGGDENCNIMANVVKKAPVPKPRTNVSLSQNPTPEPTPRLSNKHPNHHISPLNNSGDFYGSNSSLGSTPYGLQRNTDGRGSNNSLTSSTGTIRSRKSRKAPAPPPPVKELFPSTETLDSKKSSPSSSNSATPHQGRKKRPAPAPPKPARLLDPAVVLSIKTDNIDTGPKNSLSYPLQSDLDKLSDEEKALLEGNRLERTSEQQQDPEEYPESNNLVRKLVPLDFSLVSDSDDLIKQKEEDNVVYRRTIVPTNIVTPTQDEAISHDRQLEKMKDNKEAQNRNRQSQVSSGAEDSDPLFNKSSHGKWKRRKGPAPALPIPPRKVLQMLPLQEIRHELDIIEVQQQGLEKQGVILEKMIRDRCEGKNGELDALLNENSGTGGHPQNSKEVEDLILQLFELVNEKNELFRRQAELMYLRRQHRLEQEQADLEYEIRVLMAQPERNKTDTDKAREEALIARMVEVVQLRNEVVECLEMDRLREAEEDLSIKQRLELHSAKREQEMNRHTLSKLSKKEKKKQKESKKLGKSKKLDADKDADESELSLEKQKNKKKKKKFLF